MTEAPGPTEAESSCSGVQGVANASRGANDLVNIVACTAIDGARRQCLSPHLLIRNAVRANEPYGAKFSSQGTQIAVIGKIEIEHDYFRAVAIDDVADFV